MSDLTKSIQEIIEKSLPAIQADVLVDHLKNATADKDALVRANKDLKSLKSANITLSKAIQEQSKIEILAQETAKKIYDVKLRSDQLEIDILKIQLKESERRSTMVENFLRILVSNQEVNIYRHGTKPAYDPDARYFKQENFDETTEISKYKPGGQNG